MSPMAMTSALTTTASVLPCCRQWVKMLFDGGVAVGTFLMSAGKHPKVPILFARFYLFCGLSLFFATYTVSVSLALAQPFVRM